MNKYVYTKYHFKRIKNTWLAPLIECLCIPFNEYLIQYSLKSGGTKDHLIRVKIHGSAPY